MEPRPQLSRITPFDRLPAETLARVAEAVDVLFFRRDQTVLTEQEAPDSLYVLTQGSVQVLAGGEVIARYGPEDCFDLEALLRRRSPGRIVAREDTVCLALPRAEFLYLLAECPEFADPLFAELAGRTAGSRPVDTHGELAGFMIAKIGDAYVHPPLQVTAASSIHEAARAMRDNRATSLLVVREDGEIGICSGTDLRNAVVIERRSPDAPVGDIASYGLVSLEEDDFLFNALLTMTRHSISRVVIRHDGAIRGVLEQVDLLSYLSNHSHLIAVQIERAGSREELAKASHELTRVIEALHGKGVKLRYIGQLLSELNKKLLGKLFTLIAPPELIDNACLVVMGSEGREEQILKTDQDNALLLRDGYTHPGLDAITQAFTEALVAFGYPPCPGNIMVSNPYWTKPLGAFKDEIFNWIKRPSEDGFMHFAIFFDAMPVAGDTALLDEAKRYLHQQLQSNSGFFAHFARATVSFETPLGFFQNFVTGKDGQHRDELDLKKGGIFPLTHGVRSLALEHRLEPTNTLERIEALEAKGVLTPARAAELTEALTMMSTLRLTTGLRKLKAGLPQDNFVNPNELNKLERELLRDSFKIVNEFKKFITFHFKLNLVT